jgi:hypothetical protein
MDPKDFAERLKAKHAAREAEKRARQMRADDHAQIEEEAGRAMQRAIMEHVVPYFRTLKESGADIFDCRAITEQGAAEVSWVVFQFERGQVFRLGRRGAHFLVERREGPRSSGFANITNKLQTVIENAAQLTNESIGALLEELSELPPPPGLMFNAKTDLDGNPLN